MVEKMQTAKECREETNAGGHGVGHDNSAATYV